MKLKKQLLISVYLFLITCVLNSCESLLNYGGHVYNSNNEPIQDAKISLIIGRIDTVEKMGEILDTVSIEKRKELRKKGIKDNFGYNINGKMSEPIALYTDKNGYFKTRTIWFGCAFKCPDYKILVEKGDVIKVFPLKDEIKKDTLPFKLRSRQETNLSLFL
jgi:predicted HTH domain antitoxin